MIMILYPFHRREITAFQSLLQFLYIQVFYIDTKKFKIKLKYAYEKKSLQRNREGLNSCFGQKSPLDELYQIRFVQGSEPPLLCALQILRLPAHGISEKSYSQDLIFEKRNKGKESTQIKVVKGFFPNFAAKKKQF